MQQNPLDIFQDWYALALRNSPLKHPKAVCVSTISPRGIPEARFVALKNVTEAGFVFCSSLDSAKGVAIAANTNVALTFWWDHVERQVRVSGTATRISSEDADRHFSERRRDAQLTTVASEQSEPLESQTALEERLRKVEAQFEGKDVPRPANWGGYLVKPLRIEFLEFQANRLHTRTLFTCENTGWTRQLLQP